MTRIASVLAVALVVSACSCQSDLAPWSDADCRKALESPEHAPAVERYPGQIDRIRISLD